ncbi:MAG: TraR/DksA family transcriptional regulator [Desulfovibrio sp.]
MTPDQRAHIRQRIEAMIGELATTIGRLESNTKNVSLELTSIGRLSRMDSMANLAINDRMLSESKARLHKLEYALRRVDGEDYGICEECGEEIPVARLLVMPEAIVCVSCAS